jgi:transketolase
MRDKFVETLSEIAALDPRVMLITADLGFGVLDRFAKEFPSQYLNVGVAEQNMMLVATGLALDGRCVFTYSIGNFPTFRCLEMIRNDSAYHNADVKVVSIGGGFSYGPLGMSHHATEDLAVMRAIPEVTVFAPSSRLEVSGATTALAQSAGTGFLRLDKDPGVDGPQEELFEPGRPRCIRRGSRVAILTCGGILSEVVKAADELVGEGISPSIFSIHTLAPMQPTPFVEIAQGHEVLITVEEHVLPGGLGSAVLEVLNDAACARPIHRIGLRSFSSAVGSQQYLRRLFGLDAGAIIARTRLALSTR